MTRCARGLRLAALAAAVLVATVHAQPVQTLRLRSLAASCAQCHGTEGHAAADAAVRSLAGMPAAQLIEAMRGYASGERPGTLMPEIARGFSPTQIAQLAAYFAAPGAGPQR